MTGMVTESMETTEMAIDPEEMKKEANNLFIAGKRSLLIHDYKMAVENLENSCKILDQIYGVSADECGDAYLQYGIALMELARQETGVLDGVVSAQAETESSEDEDAGDEEEEEEEVGGNKETENDGKIKPDDSEKQEQISADEELAKSLAEEDIANESVQAVGATSSSVVEPIAGSSTAGQSSAAPGTEEEDEDAEPSSFECAWELLCLARDVFKRQIEYRGNEAKVKLAEALQSLGEISIEWENNEAALDLLQDSLSLRKEALSPDDRLIAETYYHIGIAHSFMNESERANDCFRSAMNVIEDRIKNLRTMIESLPSIDTCGDSINSVNDKNRKEKEIKELESLLPEMAEKIEDSKDQIKSTSEAIKELDDEESKDNDIVSKIHDSPMKPVNNISHLVKRKRDADENGTASGDGTKKLCPTNGSTDGSSVGNGDH